MNSAIGFTLLYQCSREQSVRADAALKRALAHFQDLKEYSVQINDTELIIWGRGNLGDCVHKLPDGSLLVLVGTPVGSSTWADVEEDMSTMTAYEKYHLPWEGQVILLRISADGSDWIFWTDWSGSIPVYHSNLANCRIASTLEPVVVSANGFSADDISLPGLVLLLSHGHFLADWTLFRDMHTLRPDSVTVFKGQVLWTKSIHTLVSTERRSEQGWDDLVDEIHLLIVRAIQIALDTKPEWILTLSSGLDSRLIAAIGAELGYNMRPYTWGPKTTRDGLFAKRIADALDLPWERIDLDDDYLLRYLPVWIDLFGSSMHFHGMYQLSFYEQLRGVSTIPIISGFLGGMASGGRIHRLIGHIQPGERNYLVAVDYNIFRDVNELKSLFRVSIAGALEEIADMIEAEINAFDGTWFQKLFLVNLWGRQNHFTYYQTMLADYYRGVVSPYINRDYVNFCFSLPRALLDDRKLLVEMMSRYYPKVMAIGGTYSHAPAVLTGRYLLKRRASKFLPNPLGHLLLPEFFTAKTMTTDIQSLSFCGEKAMWPIPETKELLSEWINMDYLERDYNAAIGGDLVSVRKIQAVQAFAYRLGGH